MTMLRTGIAMLLGLTAAGGAQAHTLLIACHNGPAKMVTCAGRFSDGEAATGAIVRVVTEADKPLARGKTDAAGHYGFVKPAGRYTVVLQAGPHHIANLSSEDIK